MYGSINYIRAVREYILLISPRVVQAILHYQSAYYLHLMYSMLRMMQSRCARFFSSKGEKLDVLSKPFLKLARQGDYP